MTKTIISADEICEKYGNYAQESGCHSKFHIEFVELKELIGILKKHLSCKYDNKEFITPELHNIFIDLGYEESDFYDVNKGCKYRGD